MTRQHTEFNYYCLDRLKTETTDFPVTYTDGAITKKAHFKIGLRADIKHNDCFILYTESERDLDEFVYIDAEDYYNNEKRFYQDVFNLSEVVELFKKLKAINIFEFTSLLEFTHIYEDFQEFVETNWDTLEMDKLIEL